MTLYTSYFCCHNPHTRYCQAFLKAPKASSHSCRPLLYSSSGTIDVITATHNHGIQQHYKSHTHEQFVSCVMDRELKYGHLCFIRQFLLTTRLILYILEILAEEFFTGRITFDSYHLPSYVTSMPVRREVRQVLNRPKPEGDVDLA
jgi:hypothetical protein